MNTARFLSLYMQCELIAQDAAAQLCGMDSATPAFRSTLRGLPPLPDGFVVGDVARAYLRAVLAELERMKAERAPRFSFDGSTGTLAEYLQENADDLGLCEWLCVAEVGDEFEGCTRIA